MKTDTDQFKNISSGDWTVDGGDAVSAGGEHIAFAIGKDGDTYDTQKANARLLAAAPSLLRERDQLRQALEESERALRWAAQESAGRVKAEIVGGWIHHADKAAGVLAMAGKGASV